MDPVEKTKRKRRLGDKLSLFAQVYLAMLLLAIIIIGGVGYAAHRVILHAFTSYLVSCGMAPNSGLTGAQRYFVSSLDSIFFASALIAMVIAAIFSYIIAKRITTPLKELELTTQLVAQGQRDLHVEPFGATEIASLGRALNEMFEELEETEQLKQRMISDMAHELRNPLAALQIQLEGMVDGVVPTDKAHLESLLEDTNALSDLVRDLRTVSLADEGALPLKKSRIDLRELLAKKCDRMRQIAPPGVQLILDAPDSPVMCSCDKAKIQSVIRNLLVNAFNHTQSGSVTVRLELERSETGRQAAGTEAGYARVSVLDTGSGVAEKNLPHLFERFYRSDSSRSTDTGGSGLGLPIAKRIIEAHGGTVFARENTPHGLVVGFAIPLGK